MSNTIQPFKSKIYLLKDKYDTSGCLDDFEPMLADRKIAVRHEETRTYLTYERYPKATWLQKLFCCLYCSNMPTTENSVQTLSNYIIQEWGEKALIQAQKMAKIDLTGKESLVVLKKNELIDAAQKWYEFEMQIKQILPSLMRQAKYCKLFEQMVLVSEKEELGPLLDDEIFVIKEGKSVPFNFEKLQNSLSSLRIFDKNKKRIDAIQSYEIVEGVKKAILKSVPNKQVEAKELSKFIVSVLKVKGLNLAMPIIYPYVKEGQSPSNLMSTLPADFLFKWYEECNQRKDDVKDDN